MIVLATTQIRRGVQFADLAFYEQAGREQVAEMAERGELASAWSRLDRRAALFVLHVENASHAERLMAELPIHSCELASLTLAPVAPFRGWTEILRRRRGVEAEVGGSIECLSLSGKGGVLL